ncbi:MAG: VTT domain-containing protein [Methanospirillum sp.]
MWRQPGPTTIYRLAFNTCPMAALPGLLDIFLHLDQDLLSAVQQYGAWVYAFLFLSLFPETGFVVTPFLTGDSLLFIAGAIAAAGALDLRVLLPLLMLAAFTGDQVNYWIGRYVGNRVLAWDHRVVRPHYIRSAQAFFDRYGRKSVFLGRFVPVIRTVLPFLAGMGAMRYRWFVVYNALGVAAWVLLFVVGGYFFGSIPVVRDNLSLAIVLIIVVSFAAIGVEYLRERRAISA